MNTPQTTISFADLLRAVHDLQPANDQTVLAILATLNIPLTPLMPVSSAISVETNIPADSAGEVQSETARSSSATIADPIPAVEIVAPATPVPSTLERIEQEATPFDQLAPPLDAAPVDPSLIIPEPLFRQNWQRGILAAALATEGRDGPPDIQALVEQLVRGQIVRTIQREPWPTLRRGVQLLIDRSEALTPFFADQTLLQQVITRVAGVEKTEVLYFSGLPDRAGTGLEFEWKSYQPPLAGMPVVLLTDLGIGQPPGISDRATIAEWLLFALQIRRAGCPLLAVIPYARKRCPAALRRVIRVIPWDRYTTAGMARYLVGKG